MNRYFRHRNNGAVANRTYGTPMYMLLLLLLLGAANGSITANAATLVPGAQLSDTPAVAAAVADLFQDGGRQLLLVGETGIEIVPTTGGPRLGQIEPLPAPAVSIATGDITGDGLDEIIIGTDQAGAVFALGWTGGRWALLGQSPYMWSSVVKLLTVDVTGDGRADIVALNETGQLALFSWQARSIQNVWQSPADSAPVVDVALLDDGVSTGQPIIVVADEEGRISAWQWPFRAPLATVFVWGTPTAMAAFPVEGGAGGQIAVSTARGLLYRYEWDGSGFRTTSSPLDDPRLPFDFMEPLSFSGSETPHVIAQNAGGFGLWRLAAGGLGFVAEGWPRQPLWVAAVPGSDDIIVGEARGPVAAWNETPGDYVRLTVDGTEHDLRDGVRKQGDLVLLSARDWSRVLGTSMYWDADEQRLTFVGHDRYAIVTVGSDEVWLPEGHRAATITPFIDDGRTYVPPEFPAWFGFDYEWDARRRELRVVSTHQPEAPAPSHIGIVGRSP